MQALNPSVGSNQFLTRFDSKAKRKFKIRIKFATKVKLFLGSLLIFSLILNAYLLRTNYVITCHAVIDGVDQNWSLGHLESQRNCDQLVNDKIASLNVQANQASAGNSDQITDH